MKALCVIYFLSVINLISAQSSELDSLKRALYMAKSDSSRVKILINLGNYYSNIKTDSSISYGQKALKLAKDIKLRRAEIAILLRLIGSNWAHLGNYPKSHEAALQAFQIAEKYNMADEIVWSIGAVSNSFELMGDLRSSIDFGLKALKYKEAKISKDGWGYTMGILGMSYTEIGKLDSALYFTHQAYEIFFVNKQIKEYAIKLGETSGQMGNIYSQIGSFNLALEYYRTAIPLLLQQESRISLSNLYYSIAEMFNKRNQIDSSLYYARLCLSAAQFSKGYYELLGAYKSLFTAFKNKHQIDSAFKYQSLADAVKDSMYNEEKVRSFQSISFNEKLREQEQEEDRIRAEEERKENLQWLALAVFIITISIVALLLSRVKIKPKYVETIGLLALLLFFEFIDLFIHPYIEKFTNHSPVWMLLIVAIIASILAPTHHRLTHWVKQKVDK